MFAGSIRRRLVSIVIVISILSAVVVAAIVINSVAGTLRRQTQTAFVEHNQSLANTLDTQLQSFATTAHALADMMERRSESPVTLLWPTANNMLDGDSVIERINVYTAFRDGHQMVMFRRPQEPSSIAPMAHYINNPLPSDTWFLNTIEGFRRGQDFAWRGPERAFLGDRRPVISVAVPYQGTSPQIIGVVWVDVTTQTIEAIMRERFNVDVQPGYSLLVSDTGDVVASFDLPTASSLSAASVEAVLTSTSAITDDVPTAINDPFNEGRSAFVIRSQMPYTGWQLISVVPELSLQSTFAQGVFQTAFVILLGTIVLGWLISRFAELTLSRPLLNMSTAAQEIGSGDMRYHIGYQTRKDEVGRLARALEDMKKNLAHSYEELARWSRTLEKRVAERTHELQIAREEADANAGELRAVYDASLSVVTAFQLVVVLQTLAERVAALLEGSYCGIWLLSDDRSELQLVANTSADNSRLNMTISINEGLAGRAVREGSPIIVADYLSWSGSMKRRAEPSIHQAMVVPLTYLNKPMGAVVVGRTRDARAFDDNDQRLLTLFANLASPMVRNAQLYVQRESAMKEAERANTVKTRFLASVTHELRTPLNLIINNMDFMRVGMFGDVNDEQVSRLNQTIRSAEHLLYLINDLLDVSKIEAGEMQLTIQQGDIGIVIDDAVDSVQSLLDSKDDKVTLVTDIEPELPSVSMDGRRIRQVLINLLSNAIKFTMEGEVRLKVTHDDDTIKFAVTDTGIGIPEDELGKLFESFERTDRAKQLGIEGTGLGLPISKHLVEAHGGQITIETAVGVGSTFSFSLPLQPLPQISKPVTSFIA